MEAVPPRRLARARGGGEAAQLPPLGESWPAPVGATHSEPPWFGFGFGFGLGLGFGLRLRFGSGVAFGLGMACMHGFA